MVQDVSIRSITLVKATGRAEDSNPGLSPSSNNESGITNSKKYNNNDRSNVNEKYERAGKYK